MKPLTYILILISLNCFGQNKIVPNRNPNAPKHEMKMQNDSLVISSALIIDKVNIWNEAFDFEKYFNEKYVVVDISGFPIGRYLVATSIDKHFIMSELFKVSKPKDSVTSPKPKAEIVYIKVPYNLTTTQKRRDTRESDTIYVKETREEYKQRMGYDKGKRKELNFEEQ